MLITRRSVITGIEHAMELPVTTGELLRHRLGALAQNVWPHLLPDQREFLITGITPEEWDRCVGTGLD